MTPIRRIRRIATVLAGLAAALAAFGVPPALAVRPPGPGAPGVATPPGTITPPVEVHTVVVGGMPGWQIALIAVVAALLAATLAVLVDRTRTTPPKATPPT